MKQLSLDKLVDTGILWYINRVAFHPHGYALTLTLDKDSNKVTSWNIQGNGKEVFTFKEEFDDEKFEKFQNFLKEVQTENTKTENK